MDVAEKTRFRHLLQGTVNHSDAAAAKRRRFGRSMAGEWPNPAIRITQIVESLVPRLPDTSGSPRRAEILRRRQKHVLIVTPLFFIQRCVGEVAEWSKALPC